MTEVTSAVRRVRDTRLGPTALLFTNGRRLVEEVHADICLSIVVLHLRLLNRGLGESLLKFLSESSYFLTSLPGIVIVVNFSSI
jgi:hypothetical protein